jgi:hypothetical protein
MLQKFIGSNRSLNSNINVCFFHLSDKTISQNLMFLKLKMCQLKTNEDMN